jgi:5-methylthioadenosine/S-adenosylhomocysteine deaminase
MATINGAKAALWSDEIGSLEVGKKADVAIFDMQTPDWQPVINPIANLIYACRGGADTVICNGRLLMRDKVVLSIDETEALTQAKERGARIAERAGLRDLVRPKWPIV